MMNCNSLDVRKRPSFLYIAEGFVGLLLTLALSTALRLPGAANAWQAVAIVAGIGIYIGVWYAAFRVTVIDGVLTYRTLIGRTKVIRLDDIERAHFEVGEKRYSDRDRPPVRIFIKPRGDSRLAPFDINAAVFDNDDFAALIRILAGKEPRSKCDG